jgi:DNA helicase-2/ATP-dependent DNA helicase PcrA
MRLATNPLDDESLKRIINYPARGIGNNTMEKIQMYANDNNLSLWECINKLPSAYLGLRDATAKKIADFKDLMASFMIRANTDNAYVFALDIIKQSGMMADLSDNKTLEGISRIENIEELLNGINEYTNNPDYQENGTMITEYLQLVSLITDADRDLSKDRNRVTLMTIHSAKGLEFSNVYIAGMEEGLFPGNIAIQSEHSLEEERRLFYVALTRAANKATVSFSQTRYRWGNLVSSAPSRFLHDIDAIYLSSDLDSDIVDAPEPQPERSYKPQEKKTDNARKLKPLKTEKPAEPEKIIDTSALTPGTEVEHARFGRGRLVELYINGNDVRAKISFHDGSTRILILKYANLEILKRK